MKLFKLREGPWEKLLEGNIQGYETGIYVNPSNILLVFLLEKKGEKVEGAVIEMYKIFAAEGEIGNFVESLPKEAIVLIKHTQKENIQYLVLGSKPGYSKFKEEEFAQEMEALLEKLHDSTELIKSVAKAFDLKLIELKEADEIVKKAFFSSPIILTGLATTAPTETQMRTQKGLPQKELITGEVFLGLTKEKNLMKEPLNSFFNTLVIGTNEKEAKHALHVLIESTLLSGANAIVFDWNNSFTELNHPAPSKKALEEFKLNFDPMGFPTKDLIPKEDLRINLNYSNANGLGELFGLEETSTKILDKILSSKKIDSITELKEEILKIESEETSQFDLLRAVRAINLIDSINEGFFSGKNNIRELTESASTAIGGAKLIHLDGLNEKIALLFVHNILKGMLSIKEEQGENSKRINSMIFLFEAEKFFDASKENILTQEMLDCLKKLNDYGIGFAFSAGREGSLSEELRKNSESTIYIISEIDIGIKLKGSKQYRVQLRPGLSACGEMKK